MYLHYMYHSPPHSGIPVQIVATPPQGRQHRWRQVVQQLTEENFVRCLPLMAHFDSLTEPFSLQYLLNLVIL